MQGDFSAIQKCAVKRDSSGGSLFSSLTDGRALIVGLHSDARQVGGSKDALTMEETD